MSNETLLLIMLIAALIWATMAHVRGDHWQDKYDALEAEHTQLSIEYAKLQRVFRARIVRAVDAMPLTKMAKHFNKSSLN